MRNENKTADINTSIAKGSIIVFAGQISKFILAYILMVVLTKYIGAENFGLYHIGVTIILIAAIVARLGLENGVVKLISVYRSKNNFAAIKGTFLSCIIFTLIFSVIIGTLLFFFKSHISRKCFDIAGLEDVITILVFSLPFISINFIIFSTLQAFQAHKYFTYITGFIDPLSKILFFVILFFFGMRLYGILYSYLISTIIVFVSGFIVINKISPVFKKGVGFNCEIKKLLSFSIPLSLAGIFQFMLDWTDTLMLGYFDTTQHVGIYAVALKLSLIGGFVLHSFNYIFAPIISEAYEKKDTTQLRDLFKLVTRWIFVLTLPVTLLFVIYPEVLMGFFGREFKAGSLCLIILAIGQFVNYLTGAAGYMVMMTGRAKLTMINTVGMAGLNVVLNLFMIPKYGIVGAAIATSISLCSINLIRLAEVAILLKMHPYNRQYLKPVLSGIIVGSIYFFIIPNTSLSLLSFILLCLSFFFLYFLIMYCLGLGSEEKKVLSHLRYRVLSLFSKGAV